MINFVTILFLDLNLEDYVFTTEGHLLPLSLGQMKWPLPSTAQSEDSNSTLANQSPNQRQIRRRKKGSYFSTSSPNSDFFCPSATSETENLLFSTSRQHLTADRRGYYKLIRKGVEDFASRPSSSLSSSSYHRQPSILSVPRLRAADFSATKPEHIELVKELGITVLVLKDGRVQLVHNSAAAHSLDDAEEGALFMQEMIALSKMQVSEEQRLRTVSFTLHNWKRSALSSRDAVNISLLGGPAQFGLDLATLEQPVLGALVQAEPNLDACALEEIANRADFAGKIVLAQRGGCMFIEKARNAQRLGALGIIIADNAEGSSSKTMPMFAMSGDGSTDVIIPAVFLYSVDAKILFSALEEAGGSLVVRLDALNEDNQDELVHGMSSGTSGASTDKDTLAQVLESGQQTSKKSKDSETSSSSSSSASQSLSFFDRLNSQVKFDLLSALNLRDLKEENMKLILGLLSKLALTKEKDKEERMEEDLDQEESALASLMRKVKASRRWMHSLHGARHCLNPLSSGDAFRTFLYEPFTVCV